MDRRQRKTREAIFSAFTELLFQKDYDHITVGEILKKADVGRATFYAHFPTKDFLLKGLCEELFCHVFDVMRGESAKHSHIFSCETQEDVFLHLFRHIQSADNPMCALLSSRNNVLFFRYFNGELYDLVESQLTEFKTEKTQKLPDSFLVQQIASAFLETIRWWANNGMKEAPEVIATYFYAVIPKIDVNGVSTR